MITPHLRESAHLSPWERSVGRPLRSRAGRLAIGLSIAAHAAVAYGVYQAKFVPHWREPVDSAVSIEVLSRAKPQPPKPAPETPTPAAPEPPRPALEIRATPAPPISFAGPTLPAPVLEPVEPAPPPVAPEPPRLPPAPRTIANPDWLALPGPEDVARYYPERAQRLGVSGRVVMSCSVTVKGGVSACSVLSEDPSGHGFGEAAVKLSRLFRMKPKMEDGQPIEGATVNIPVAFRISG